MISKSECGTNKARKTIALHAYYKWIDAGSPPGDGKKFWMEAECELTHADVQMEEVIEIDFNDGKPSLCKR